MKTKLLAAFLTIAASTALFAADSPANGSAAPDFSLTDSKGKTQSISQYKGKYVVLEWFNPDCKIVYQGAIDSKPSPNAADIPSSTNYVKVALDESLAGKTISNSNTKP